MRFIANNMGAYLAHIWRIFQPVYGAFSDFFWRIFLTAISSDVSNLVTSVLYCSTDDEETTDDAVGSAAEEVGNVSGMFPVCPNGLGTTPGWG